MNKVKKFLLHGLLIVSFLLISFFIFSGVYAKDMVYEAECSEQFGGCLVIRITVQRLILKDSDRNEDVQTDCDGNTVEYEFNKLPFEEKYFSDMSESTTELSARPL